MYSPLSITGPSVPRPHTSRGFTLIELLVVISIISLLSSVVFASASYARARATDTAQVANAHAIQNAITAYAAETGNPPQNYVANANGQVEICTFDSNSGCEVAFSDEPAVFSVVVEGQPEPVMMNRFQLSMNELVTAGYLPEIPESANRNSPLGYLNFGETSNRGAVVFSALPTATESVEGAPGTCRFPTEQEEQEEQSVSFSTKRDFLAALTAKVAQASNFFSEGEQIFELGPSVQEVSLTSGSLLRRFRGVALIEVTSENMLLVAQEEYTMTPHCMFSQSCTSENIVQDFNSVTVPTCSSEEPNRSYCLCTTY